MGIVAAKARRWLARWLHDSEGVTGTEYAILLSLLIIGSMGVIGSIGQKFAVLYGIIAGALPAGF